MLLRQLQSEAQEARDTFFFDSGAGVSFANSTEIGDRVAHLEAAQPIAAGLEGAAESALQERSCCLLQRTELADLRSESEGWHCLHRQW